MKTVLLWASQPYTMPGMTYVSPFGAMDADHEWPDALCLSRTRCADASVGAGARAYRMPSRSVQRCPLVGLGGLSASRRCRRSWMRCSASPLRMPNVMPDDVP